MEKEYFVGDIYHKTIDQLKPRERLPLDQYVAALDGLTLAYHDIYVETQGGIFLVERKERPAKGILWPLGGRKTKGLSMRDSVRAKVNAESNLILGTDDEIIYLGNEPPMVYSSESEHAGGLDCLANVYAAKARGQQLELNHEHTNPTLVYRREQDIPQNLPDRIKVAFYTYGFRTDLHPYVRDYLHLAMVQLLPERRDLIGSTT